MSGSRYGVHREAIEYGEGRQCGLRRGARIKGQQCTYEEDGELVNYPQSLAGTGCG